MLGQDADEALQRAEHRAVNHDRARKVVSALRTAIPQFEPLRQVEVELNGGTLKFPLEGVGDGDIDLGSVELPDNQRQPKVQDALPGYSRHRLPR